MSQITGGHGVTRNWLFSTTLWLYLGNFMTVTTNHRTLVGIHIWSITLCYCQWPWVSFKGDFSCWNFSSRYVTYKVTFSELLDGFSPSDIVAKVCIMVILSAWPSVCSYATLTWYVLMPYILKHFLCIAAPFILVLNKIQIATKNT